MRKVVVTGMGFVTSIGNSRAGVAKSLLELRHGISSWDPIPGADLPVNVAGIVKGFDVSSPNPNAWSWPTEYPLERRFVRGCPPHGVYAACALSQALAESGLSREDLSDGDTGLFCAGNGSPMLMRQQLNRMADTRWQRGNPLGIVSSVAGSLNFNLSAEFGIRGATCGFVSACASGSHALGYAFDEITLGRQRRMLVVAGEDLNLESLLPFHAMNALALNPDPDTASRPFDSERSGFVATGGAVALVLESEESALARGIRPQATMISWGQASDGYHIAHPHPEGRGLRDAMKRALAAAEIQPDSIDYINAHAPSTRAGDRAEALAVREVFTAHGANPAVSSTKALTGHGLSLAGAMEAAFCVLALKEGFIPGQAHLRKVDPEFGFLNLPSKTRLNARPKVVLNNNSGFGGANVCLIFSRYE